MAKSRVPLLKLSKRITSFPTVNVWMAEQLCSDS